MCQCAFNKASKPCFNSECWLDAVIKERTYICEMKLEITAERHHCGFAGATDFFNCRNLSIREDDFRIRPQALSHTWSCGNDNQFLPLKPGCHLIEVGKARRHAGDHFGPPGHL